jgi:poly-gamma-glutamate capsule biosynthesis protein CapA/YwtB (metallophosphatase superfamily)
MSPSGGPARRGVWSGLVVAGAVLALVACASAASADRPAGRATSISASATAVPARVSPSRQARPAAPRAAAAVRIAAVGDTMLGDTPVLPPDPASYLSAVRGALRGRSQIVFGNLEGTLTRVDDGKCGGSNGGECFAFRDPPHYARYLAADGFTVLNNANNHSHDFGQAGLDQTVHAIHAHGMAQTGLPGEITVVHAGPVRVAIVAFAPYSNTADLLRLRAAAALIRKARAEARVVVVYMHAGAEGADALHVTGHEEYFVGEDRGNPERFAHLAVRNGASLVIASGPHVVRGMEFYRHHLIAYSLGNFANYHNFATGGVLADSAILHVSLTATGRFRSARLVSVRLADDGRPSLGGATVRLVRTLSKEDFGDARAHLSRSGVITPPDRAGS